MMRRGLLALLLLAPATLSAQSTMFGVRAIGHPSLPMSTRAAGSSGAFTLFDPLSALSPASIMSLSRSTASFHGAQSWRTTENPHGSASGNDTRFPLFIAGGAMSSRLVGTVSASVYTDRTFALAVADTVELRGLPVGVTDTLISRGGVTDLRAAVAWRSRRVALGVGLHLLTGTNRMSFRRVFSDTVYAPLDIKAELSYNGYGFSAGAIVEPVNSLQLAGFVRMDRDLSLERDSLDVSEIPLPLTIGAGLQWAPAARLSIAGQVVSQSWSRADQVLRDRGGAGAANTLQVAGGLEFARSPTRRERFPLRLGVHWAQLPFPLTPEQGQGREFGVSIGTGFGFSGGRGMIDLALERTWRSQEGGYEERDLGLRFGVVLRP